MKVVFQTADFKGWIRKLKDQSAKARISARLLRLSARNLVDCKAVGDEVSELRFMFGPGYRVYFSLVGETVILLIAGGDKKSQFQDIVMAKKTLRQWKDERHEQD